jgi:hypothetical protein
VGLLVAIRARASGATVALDSSLLPFNLFQRSDLQSSGIYAWPLMNSAGVASLPLPRGAG